MKRKLLRITAIAAVVVLALSVAAAGAADIEGDQVFVGDTTIAAGDTVKGNVTHTGGFLIVLGTIEGDIDSSGTSTVAVLNRGTVKGNIDKSGPGIDAGGFFLSVRVAGQSLVEGDISEQGNGFVTILSSSTVKGNILEQDDGSIQVDSSTVEGNIEEQDAGDVDLGRSLVKGNICERGTGSIRDFGFNTVDGNLAC